MLLGARSHVAQLMADANEEEDDSDEAEGRQARSSKSKKARELVFPAC